MNLYEFIERCLDTSDGKMNSEIPAWDCSDYVTSIKNEEMGVGDCDLNDTDDFKANQMCCICGGGTTGNTIKIRKRLS